MLHSFNPIQTQKNIDFFCETFGEYENVLIFASAFNEKHYTISEFSFG